MEKQNTDFGDVWRGIANHGNTMKVFDWHKAVELIKEHNIKNADAGLAEDWNWTGGTIYEDGKPVDDSYTYLASTWATPTLEDTDTEELYECWIWETDTEWDAETRWPESARALLNG